MAGRVTVMVMTYFLLGLLYYAFLSENLAMGLLVLDSSAFLIIALYNLTQADLAKLFGARRETVLFMEKGTYNPSLKLAHNVAKALNTTIDEVFIFDDE